MYRFYVNGQRTMVTAYNPTLATAILKDYQEAWGKDNVFAVEVDSGLVYEDEVRGL